MQFRDEAQRKQVHDAYLDAERGGHLARESVRRLRAMRDELDLEIRYSEWRLARTVRRLGRPIYTFDADTEEGRPDAS